MSALRTFAPALLSLATLVGCDHATKFAAKAELEGAPSRPVVGSVVELRYVENTDVGFSLLRWIPAPVRRPLLLVLGALAIAGLATWLVRGAGDAATRVALVLILGGAIGNYLDRLFRGYVIDFIRVPHWPVFNLADAWLTVGIAIVAWTALRRRPAPRPA